MKNLSCLITATLLLLYPCLHLFAQEDINAGTGYSRELYHSVLDAYGLDQVLMNGICYEDDYFGSDGHPFLSNDMFHKGTIVFRDRKYQGMDLKYDIYKQQIILYTVQNNINTWLIPPNDFISSFTLDDKLFVKLNFDGVSRFYQLTFNGKHLKCIHYWFKSRYDSDDRKDYNSSKFTDERRISYLVIDGSLKKYTGNKSFVRLFPHKHQTEIKQYIKKSQIRVSKSSESELMKLLSLCETLL